MHAQVRHARFNLVVFGVASLFAAVLVAIWAVFVQKGSPFAALGAYGLLGLWGFGDWYYRGKPKVVMDERDIQIRDKARLGAWGATWGYWGIVCMVPWFYAAFKYGFSSGVPEMSIAVLWLPLVYMGGAVVHVVTWSLAIFHFYGREPE